MSATLATLAMVLIYARGLGLSFDGGGILTWVWLCNSSNIGCVCQFGVLFFNVN